jgi:hypothetical protein
MNLPLSSGEGGDDSGWFRAKQQLKKFHKRERN